MLEQNHYNRKDSISPSSSLLPSLSVYLYLYMICSGGMDIQKPKLLLVNIVAVDKVAEHLVAQLEQHQI